MNSSKLPFGRMAAVACLALATQTQAAVDPNFYVFLAFGQSNMEGYANLSGDITTADKTSLPRFQVMGAVSCTGLSRTKDQWSPGIAPLFRCNTGLSPADYFARTLVDSLPSTIKIGIVPVAVAGSKIEGFDLSTYQAYYSSEQQYMKDIVSLYGGNPYARLVAMAKEAQKTGVIKGIILHQGESNTGDAGDAWAKKVSAIYQSLLKDLGLNANDVPFLAGQLANGSSFNAKIDALKNTIPTAYSVSSSGLALHTNDTQYRVHFSAASYREFGKRYAQEMLKHIQRTPSGVLSNHIALTANADYVVYDVKGTRMAGFHALDEASLDNAVSGIQKNLPKGIYWVRNATTGSAQKVVNGL